MKHKGLGDAGFLFLLIVVVSGPLLVSKGVEGDVQCYVCSWQKPTPSNNLTREDTCTHYHFRAEYASIVNCSRGCEAVTFRRSKDEEVEHFRRNCLNARSDQGVDRCYNHDQKFEYIQSCNCHSDLCNYASSTFSMGQIMNHLLASVITILLASVVIS